MRYLPAAALLLTSACSGEERKIFSPELPADIDLAAALIFDGAGELSASTGITRWGENKIFELKNIPEDRVGSIAVAGWSGSDFSGLVLPREDVLETTSLIAAEGCTPRLPEPRSFLALEGAVPEDRVPLSAAWLEDNCPVVQDTARASVDCVVIRCPVGFEQSGCRVLLDLDLCDLGRQMYRIDWRGELCAESLAPICAPADPTPPSLSRLECTDSTGNMCAVDVFQRPPQPLFAVESRQVLPVPPKVPEELGRLDVRTCHPRTGYLADLVVLDGRVIVSSFDGRYHGSSACGDREPNRAHIYSAADLSEVETATVPPCLSGLVAEAEGDHFFGIFGIRDERRSAGRFDASARLTAERALDLPEPDARHYDVIQARRTPRTGEVLVLFQWTGRPPRDEETGALLVGFDPQTLEERILYSGPGREPASLAEAENAGHLVISDDGVDSLVYLDRGSFQELIEIEVPHFVSASIAQLEYHPAGGDLLVLIPIEEPALHLFNSEPRYRRNTVFYEHDFAPLIAAPWPGDPGLMFVAGGDNGISGEPRATFVLFDPLNARYLPGAERIGFGVPSRAITVNGAIYLTLPWEAKLLKVTSPVP